MFMGPCCNSGWAKLDKYYSLTERSPVYVAALVLCPQWKWEYIEGNWPESWQLDCKKKMREFWESEYRSTAISVPQQVSESAKRTQNTFAQWRQQRRMV